MFTFVERMISEHLDLQVRCTKLNEFLHSSKYLELDDENRALLNAQYNAMMAYQFILKRRIKINGGKL